MYTNLVTEKVDYEDLISFISESTSIIEANKLSTDVDYKNGPYAASVDAKDVDESDSKKDGLIKTILNKVKEIWNRFISFLKTQFGKLYEILHKFYLEHNGTDNYFSKFKNIVTYDNLKKCKDKGWKGISTKLPEIGSIARANDSSFIKDIVDGSSPLKNEDIEAILSCNEVEDAQDKYNNIKDIIKKKYKESKELMIFSKNFRFNSDLMWVKANLKDPREVELPYFTIPSNYDEDNNLYFPTKDGFSKCKQFAESGEKFIKETRDSYKFYIQQLKLDKRVMKDNYQINKKNNNDKINTLYYKAKYEVTCYLIQTFSSIANATVGVIKTQYSTQLLVYLQYIQAIKKYKIA
jgi:hypothetical protein